MTGLMRPGSESEPETTPEKTADWVQFQAAWKRMLIQNRRVSI